MAASEQIPAYISLLAASDFVQKVTQTYATQIAVAGLQMITTVVIARALGPAGRGLYAVAVALGMVGVRLGTFGLHASNTYYVAKKRELLPGMVANTLIYSLLAGGLIASVLWETFRYIPRIALLQGPMLALALLWIPFGLAYLLMQNLLIGIGEIRTYNVTELTGKIAILGLVVIIVVSHHESPEMLFVAGLLVLFGTLGSAFVCLRRACECPLVCSWTLARESISVGFRAYLISFFGFLVLRLDLLMVQKLSGAYQSGNYSIASTMADAVYLLPTAFATILFPKLCGISDPQLRLRVTARATAVLAALLVPISVLASFLAVPAVHLIFGASYAPAGTAFIWLIPGIVFLGMETVAVQFLNSFGYPGSVIIIWIFCALLNVALNLWAIPAYGINGAAAVSSITYITTSVFIFAVIARTRKSTIQAASAVT